MACPLPAPLSPLHLGPSCGSSRLVCASCLGASSSSPRPLPWAGMIVEINPSVIVVLSWSVALCGTIPAITTPGASCIARTESLTSQPPPGSSLTAFRELRSGGLSGGLLPLTPGFLVCLTGLDIESAVQGPDGGRLDKEARVTRGGGGGRVKFSGLLG